METIDEIYLARLCRCANRNCNHFYVEGEMDKVRSKRLPGVNDHVCPSCGYASYYTVDDKGLRSRKTRWGAVKVDMREVSPSRRLSKTCQQSLLEAKFRYLDAVRNLSSGLNGDEQP